MILACTVAVLLTCVPVPPDRPPVEENDVLGFWQATDGYGNSIYSVNIWSSDGVNRIASWSWNNQSDLRYIGVWVPAGRGVWTETYYCSPDFREYGHLIWVLSGNGELASSGKSFRLVRSGTP